MELILILVSLLTSLLCCAGTVLLLLLVVGFVLLRKRGKKNVTAKDAMKAGAESVSQVFVRGKGGLQDLDEDDDD